MPALAYAVLRDGTGSVLPQTWFAHDSDRTSRSPGKTVVMVVDDEKWARELTARMLRDEGYQVIEAASGEEALQYLGRRGAVNLVLADIAMPEMDGLQLADQLRTSYPQQPVMLMTGFSGVLAKIGMQGLKHPLLTKPFSAAQLTARVRDALNQVQD
jgi:CheY-like chemotaxis protein